eukprot:4034421-Prymnesium_polylepis.1
MRLRAARGDHASHTARCCNHVGLGWPQFGESSGRARALPYRWNARSSSALGGGVAQCLYKYEKKRRRSPKSMLLSPSADALHPD